MSATFAVVGNQFQLDGQPFQVLSGAVHYFRVPRAYWRDRIHKAHQMGLNTIETYVPWNLHEPRRGEWIDTDMLDLAGFLDAVADEGMKAIVRPGPFICAEFNGGGLPGWLSDSGRIPVRGSDPRYLEPTLEYLDTVYGIVAPRQIDRGGPVILVQIENEYGAYGEDAVYLRTLVDATRSAGITVPLTTVDQPRPEMLQRGTLPDLLATASFGSRTRERLQNLREVQPTGPLMCSEFWDGWFDQWGDYHHVTSATDSAAELRTLLELGASVNIYMVHGGTNFGFTNGANDKGLYRPIATSYDYDAPLDEAGHPTEKYWAFQDVLKDFTDQKVGQPEGFHPAPTPQPREIARARLLSAIDSSDAWRRFTELPTMDQVEHYQGFMAYRASFAPLVGEQILEFVDVRDRAVVFADGRVCGVIERMDNQNSILLPGGTSSVTLVVEDQGRVNYGPRIGEAKGLIGPALISGREVTEWEIMPLPFEQGEQATALVETWENNNSSEPVVEPTLLQYQFECDQQNDLFFSIPPWQHGLLWINGYLLGRFNSRGPQKTLYVPGPLLRPGKNDILILEMGSTPRPHVAFSASPDLGPIDW